MDGQEPTMRRILAAALIVTAAGTTGAGAMDSAFDTSSDPRIAAVVKEHSPKLREIPEPVRAALLREAEADARIDDVERRTERGRAYYLAKFRAPDHSWAVLTTEDGIIVDSDRPHDGWGNAPEAVRTVLLQEAAKVGAGARILWIDRESRGGRIVYDAVIASSGRFDAISLSQDGQRVGGKY
jgi:hypothetical protein